jgi:hypothetical protein
MSETIHLKLPYLDAAQAQKHVTHNEALRRLDALAQLAVLDATLAEPPETPAEGDRYIVAADATGDWADEDGVVAHFVDGAWAFAMPAEGWVAFDVGAGALLVRHEDSWQAIGSFLGAVDRLGVNATADATNRLAVRSPSVLFSGIEAADAGTGDIRFTVNKEADADTATLLFQSGLSGRAEIGLAGDTDFVFKVSPDGSAWTESIRIDKDTGLPAILYDNATSGLAADTVQEAIDEIAALGGGGGGGAVASVFGRTGAVVAAAGDYDASEVDNDSSVTGAKVSDALNTLKTGVDAKLAAASNLSDVASAATAFANIKQAASDTATGVVELATNAETQAGSDGARAVTPAGLASAIGVTVQGYDADTAKLDVEDQTVTGGARVTSKSLGTQTTGTLTPDPGDRALQHYTTGSAHTLAPGSNTGSYILDITNNGSAGAITTSGWTRVTGDAFTTTNGHKFRCFASVGDGGSLLVVQALQ